MLKKNGKYFIFLGLVFGVIVYLQINAPKPMDWNKTFKSKDKIPFGCSAFYDVLEQSAFKDRISKVKDNIYKTLNEEKAPSVLSSTIFINDNIRFDKVETRMLLEYVAAGNKVLLAAGTFDGLLADTLKLKTSIAFSFYQQAVKDSVANTIVFHPKSKDKKLYTYKETVPPVYFTSVDTAKAGIIATDLKQNPVFISIKHGKGMIYALTVPEVFANYNFVRKSQRLFPYTVISYLNMPEVRFDEYYKTFNEHISSELQFIFNNDSLYAAYGVALIGILVFMLFNMKRRQRPIPIIVPPSNSTIEFVEVIGNVYFHSRNHKVIAEEKILAFLESIRNKFQVNTQHITDDVLKRIAALSGIERKEINRLFEVIDQVQYARNIGEHQLIELNTLIEQFHKNNKR